jgi:hypothetical protein
MSTRTSPVPPQEPIAPSAPPEDTGASAADPPSVTQEGVPDGPDGPLTTAVESVTPLRESVMPPAESEASQPQITVQGVPDGQGDHPPDGGQNMRNALPLSKLGM